MKKQIVIKLKSDPLQQMKETSEERLERVRSSRLRAHVVESKKTKYNRQKFKRGQNYR